ncbi:MAG: hypothetical protein FWH34_01255, partial [Desulfovibrionaceae bacterium]|nr:hypothetical protein [Desulfovibrionaceae bacterium]
MERIYEFTVDGKNFIYIDVSNIKKNEDFIDLIDIVKKVIKKYPDKSVYTIINIDGIIFDTDTKEIAAKCFEHNKPYVKYAAIIGSDGIKNIMTKAVCKISGRKNV